MSVGRANVCYTFSKRIIHRGGRRAHLSKRRTNAVAGLTCTGCENNVENAIRSVPGVRRVEANHDDESVEDVVDDDVDDQRIGDAIYDAGYEFVG